MNDAYKAFVITDAQGKEVDRMSGEHSLEALVSFTDNAFKRMRQKQKTDR